MDLIDAIEQRRSIRSFLPDPVSDEQLAELLALASRSPSGGNVQPWEIWVVNGQATRDLLAQVASEPPQPEPEYEIYPPNLFEPHRSARFELGEQMYALLGIPRDDKAARLAHLARNFEFFGAPAAIFCFVDRRMGPPQWSDLGMFLQTFMLAATAAGLATCPQEAWAARSEPVRRFCGAPEELMLFCGVAVGYADPDAPVNSLRSERRPVSEFARFV